MTETALSEHGQAKHSQLSKILVCSGGEGGRGQSLGAVVGSMVGDGFVGQFVGQFL